MKSKAETLNQPLKPVFALYYQWLILTRSLEHVPLLLW
jgi:hypothetical protein